MLRFNSNLPQAQTDRSLLLIDVFRNRRITILDDPDLVRDLHSLNIVERAQGMFYLEQPHDEHGHGDRGDAFSLALVLANKFVGDASQEQYVPERVYAG